MFRTVFRKVISRVASAVATTTRYIAVLVFRLAKWLLLPIAWLMGGVAIILLILLFIVPTTSRDLAYRNIDPQSELCDFDQGKAWDVLADASIDNDELKAIAKFPEDNWERKFSCSLQRHLI